MEAQEAEMHPVAATPLINQAPNNIPMRRAPPRLLVKEASRRSMVRSDSLRHLKVEMDRMKQEAPQALALPAEWRKEDVKAPPPCEIIFDASCTLDDNGSDLDSVLDGSCDSLAGSCCLDHFTSSCDSEDENDDANTNNGDDETREAAAEEDVEEEEEEAIVENISDAELTRQLNAIQINPSPSRVQGICQHWHALCTQSDNNEFAVRLMEHGGMEALLDAMILQKDFPQVQEAACWVLGALVFQDATFKEWFGECSGVQSVLSAMKSFPQSAWVQEAGCAALQCLTYNHQSSQELVHQVGGLHAILDAMSNHTNSSGVQEQGCAALSNLMGNQTVRPFILQGGGKSATLLAMKTHPDHAGIQEYGCSALGNLGNDETDAELVGALGAAMKRHASHAGVMEACLGALQNFAGTDHHGAGELLASIDLPPSNTNTKACQSNNPLLDNLATYVRDITRRHPQLRGAITKLLRTRYNLSASSRSDDASDSFGSPAVTTRKALREDMASPTEVTTAFVDLSVVECLKGADHAH